MILDSLDSESGFIAAGSCFVAALVAAIGFVWRGRIAKNLTTFGSSRWASLKDLRMAKVLDPAGVFLGQVDDQYLRHDGPEHVMAFAPTRSGKGVGLVVPTLLSWTGSAVIHDIKGENWQLTAGWRSTFSRCLLFDPTNPANAKYNPLLEVRKGLHEVRDVQNIADIFVDPEGVLGRRTHWEKTGHALLVGATLHVLYAETDKTLSGVASFLSDPERSFEQTLWAMMNTDHLKEGHEAPCHPFVAQAARELLNKSENEHSGVLSTAMSFLGLCRDPTVANVTSSCDWRIADLVEPGKPVSPYLVVPPSDISRTKPLVRLILNQIGRRLTETLERQGDASRRQVLLMLDEFPALGRLDFFESALAFMAGYGLRAFLIAQSLNQIDKAIWTIPAEKMKARRVHAVPLSKQVLAYFSDLQALTGKRDYAFPSLYTPRRPMSENTVNVAFRRMGFSKDEITAHGLRATASTLLNESGKWNPDAIERALAHWDSNAIRGTYSRGEYWQERV